MFGLINKYSSVLYFFFTALCLIGMPLGTFFMSVGTIGLSATFIFSGELIQKWQKVKSNRLVWLLVGVYLIHLIGGLYSSDYDYLLKDLKVKLPLLALPIIFSAIPKFSLKRLMELMWVFVLSVLFASFLGFAHYKGWIGDWDKHSSNTRDMAIYVSHIRLSLFCVFVILFLVWLYFKESSLTKFVFIPIVLWLFLFLSKLQSFTGMLVLAFVALTYLLYKVFTSKKLLVKMTSVVLLIVLPLTGYWYVRTCVSEYYQIAEGELEMLEETENGNKYKHNPDSYLIENGHYIYRNICWGELHKQWNMRSTLHFDSLDARGMPVQGTIIRYLSSKGQRKDSAAIVNLSDEEIENIENGMYTVASIEHNLCSRIKSTVFEWEMYRLTGNPAGNSIAQRLTYWTIAWEFIKEHPIVGVGPGDVNNSFMTYYEEKMSEIPMDNRRRTHNQYLTIFMGLGIIGLLVFLVSVFTPIFLHIKKKEYLIFAAMMVAAFIWEDMLETQAGVAFYALFNSLFLFQFLPSYYED